MKPSGNFNVNELNTFDIKEYFFKIIDHWKLFVVTILLGLLIANIVNRRSQKIYKLASVITVKDEQNPLFTSSTNIAFNWGGPSDKVETIITILQSRTHNEKVVEKLNYNIEYLQEGNYRKEDVYGSVPFSVELDTMFFQLQGTLIQLDFLDKDQVRVFVDYEEDEYNLLNYAREKTKPFCRTLKTSIKNLN